MIQNKTDLLKKLEALINQGILTPTNRIGLDTFLCMTESTPQGMAYHQRLFQELPDDWRRALDGQTRGYSLGTIKVIGVFDVWPGYIETPKKPVNFDQ